MPKSQPTAHASLFRRPVPQMPDGYYAGDQPNPHLRAFVEAHLAQRPYDPVTDTYAVPAFTTPIETTKATAIYNMHTYWSKKPHDAIRQYIQLPALPGPRAAVRLCAGREPDQGGQAEDGDGVPALPRARHRGGDQHTGGEVRGDTGVGELHL